MLCHRGMIEMNICLLVIRMLRLPSIALGIATLQLVFGKLLALLTYLSFKGMIFMFGCVMVFMTILDLCLCSLVVGYGALGIACV
jgi:energy-converting hydrogenase Eha subunit E